MLINALSDTSSAAERAHAALLRRAGPARRLSAGLRLSRDAIALSREGLRRSRPGAADADVLLEWVALHYGADLAVAVRRRMERRV